MSPFLAEFRGDEFHQGKGRRAMNRYFVRFQVETLASIAERSEQQQRGNRPIWKFSWLVDDAKLVAYDILREVNSVFLHEGLGLDLDVPGENPNEAIDTARNLAEGLVSLISYATASACKPAILISAYEIVEGQADVDVAWFPHDSQRLLGDLRPIDPTLLNLVYMQYDKADEDRKWRISQATQWLRKGALELETIGQFVAFWAGLEASSWALLDPLPLETTVSYPTCSNCKSQILACPECGEDLGRRDTMAGVARVFEQHIEGGRNTYRHIRSNRGRLLHGGKKLKPDFLAALRKDLPILRKALSMAIGVCLGLEETDMKRIAGTQLRRAVRPLALKISGKLKAFSRPPLDRPDQQPFVEHKPEERYSLTPEGKLNIAFEQTLTMRNGSFQGQKREMWGDEHAKAVT